MPFDEQFSDIYKFGIKGAAEDAGAYAERVDEQFFGEGILDRIFNQINKADVIIADMTGKNPNVFYEVGYAHALNKVVLLITQSVEDIPFDLKHRQHIVYGGKIEQLRQDLTKRIEWASIEAARRNTGPSTERILVRLGNVDLSSGLSTSKIPEFNARVPGSVAQLPLYVWNGSEYGILEVSHVYLFLEDQSEVVPVTLPLYYPVTNPTPSSQGVGFGTGISFTIPSVIGPTDLDAFIADAIDAPDVTYPVVPG